MKNKNIYILGAVLVILAAVSYFVMRDTSGEKKTQNLSEKLFTADSLSIDKFEIERNGKKVIMEKKAGLWNVTSPVLYTANQQFIGSALSSLKSYKLSSIVSANPGNKDFYGFNDTNYTKVTVYQNGSLAGVILVGNSAPGAAQTYLKKPDGNEVYLANEFLFNNFVKFDLSEWRDKTVISIPVGSIRSIDFDAGTEKYTVTKDTTMKFYVGNDTVSTTVFDGVTSMLSNFTTQNFKDTTLVEDIKSNFSARVIWTKDTEFKFYKYGIEESKKYLMQVSGVNQVFEVDENFVKAFIKPRAEILGKK
ncbi:MAG: DUF4340 domain-containing protein [Candidatus Kapaibacterium sp.]